MPDLQPIQNQLDRICSDLEKAPLKTLYPLTPYANTLGTTAKSIMNGSAADIQKQSALCQSICIRVRDMSSAAYVVIGTSYGQDARITAVGDYFTVAAPDGFVFDANLFFAKADAGTPIVEVTGMFYMTNTVAPPVQVQR